MFVTISNTSIDVLNNPYFTVKTYLVNPLNAKTGADEVNMLTKCPNATSHLLKYGGKLLDVGPTTNNTVCFKDPDTINIRSNWWQESY